MAKFRFTKTALQGLPLPDAGKRETHYDTEIPKLALRVTAAGAKAFYVVRRKPGGVDWVKLGSFPEMTVEQARKAALNVLGEYADGGNVAEARRELKGEPTFAEALGMYLTGKRNRSGQPLADSTRRDYSDAARMYCDGLSGKKLSAITEADVLAAQRKAAKKSPAQSARVIAICSAVFRWAQKEKLFSGVIPTTSASKPVIKARERFAQAAELPYLLEAIGESPQRDFFLLAMLTGARRANVQAMRWRELELTGNEPHWAIPKTKNGTSQHLPLTAEAVHVLQARREAAELTHKANRSGQAMSPFVFPGTGASGHLQEPKRAWVSIKAVASSRRCLDLLASAEAITAEEKAQHLAAITQAPAPTLKALAAQASKAGIEREEFDLTDIRIHDLRRTLGSWQAMTGASLAIIGQSLNHKSLAATQVYARISTDPVRLAMSTATSAMLQAAGLRDAAEVVPLKRGAA